MTRPEPTVDTTAAAARILPPLLRLTRAIDVSLRATGAAIGLTPAQAETLRFAATVRHDMATIGQLARVLGVSHATAVGIVDPLIRRGLLQRLPHPYDGRRRVLGLTPAGRGAQERLESLGTDLAAALGSLDPGAAEALELGLGAAVDVLRRRGALVVAAACAGCVHFQPDAAPGAEARHRCALLARYLSDVESRMACPEHQPAA